MKPQEKNDEGGNLERPVDHAHQKISQGASRGLQDAQQVKKT